MWITIAINSAGHVDASGPHDSPEAARAVITPDSPGDVYVVVEAGTYLDALRLAREALEGAAGEVASEACLVSTMNKGVIR